LKGVCGLFPKLNHLNYILTLTIIAHSITMFPHQIPFVLQVFIELPYIFVQTLIYGIIVYSMIGFDWKVGKFLWYIFFMYFTLLYFTFYGMMAVAVTPNYNIAAIVSSAFYAIWNLFSGFVIPRTVSFNPCSCFSALYKLKL
jgi:ABC-type multidrug transport system permease subunit